MIRALLLSTCLATPAQADFFWGSPKSDIFIGTDHTDEMHGNGGHDRLEGGDGNDILSGGNDAGDETAPLAPGFGPWDDVLYGRRGRNVIHLGPRDYGNFGQPVQMRDIAVIHKAGPKGYTARTGAMVNRFWPGYDLIALEGGHAGVRVLRIVAEGNQIFGAHFRGATGERFFVKLDHTRDWFVPNGDFMAYIRKWFIS